MAKNPEVMLLSSVLRDNDFHIAMAANLTPEMFHSCQAEFEFIANYYQKYRKVPTKLAFKNKFPEFIIAACNDSGHFSQEVIKSHTRYRLTGTMRDVTEFITNGDIEKAVAKMYAEIIGISAEVGGANDVDIVSDFQALYDEAEEKANRVLAGGMVGVPTGFETLDERTGGFQPSELWVWAARLGEAKSWSMMKSAAKALAYGKRVQYNTLEMSRSQVAYRMHTLMSSQMGASLFSNLDLQHGRNFDLKAYRKFLRNMKEHVKGHMFITDGSRGRISPLTIAAQIERNQPDIVFIDYITLMDGANTGDWAAIGRVTGELKQLAAQYNIPIVGAAQLNRERGLGKDPAGPEALAQSDAIGQDADGVITNKKISESVLKMRLAKYRHGPANFMWHVDFRPAEGVFEEINFDKAMALQDQDDERTQADESRTRKLPTKPRPSNAPGKIRKAIWTN